MCIAKARVAKCGHTIEHEIMSPCANYTGGPTCTNWDENRLNKVFLKDRPICIACHLQKEQKLCGRWVDAERELVRFPQSRDGKGVWEERLRYGVRMQAEVCGLDGKVGREGGWREETGEVEGRGGRA
ncbi:hypothetical protein IMSHALPRED_000548 [Imshaugia aleurites]|uniref:Uncharacterized protein n=1 Tax=Imshaugia aleurites TaxID=172621 RepID=A0A8H3IXH5_9LECA|nr:hypothetical protein IMSHALPRED_000548 [Imshaugia aleurites]